MFLRVIESVNNLISSQESLFGSCKIKEIIDEDNVYFINEKKVVINVENELYEIDMSWIQDAFKISNSVITYNPIQNILIPLGMLALYQEIEKKFYKL